MIFANGGVQDRGYERKIRGGGMKPEPMGRDRAMFSSQTGARMGNYF